MLTVKFQEQQKEWAIKGAAGLVTLIFCYSVMIQPVFRDIAALRQSIADSRKRLELHREIEGFEESLAENERALATVADRSMLLGKISDIASQTQIDVATLTPRTEPEGGYVKLRIEMEGRGSFFSLIKFLKAVEKIAIATKVRDVSVLRQASGGTGDQKYPLQIHLAFETFLKQRAKKNNA
jgi:type II secretory pathway component PulM